MKTHEVYLKMCQNLAELSKCKKVQIACMIVFEGRIITTGVNGTPSKYCNCSDKFADYSSEELLAKHSEWSLKHEIHAEMNALIFALRNGIQIPQNSILYCTHEPCDNCLKHIYATGIQEVWYINKYYNNIVENTFGMKIQQLKI